MASRPQCSRSLAGRNPAQLARHRRRRFDRGRSQAALKVRRIVAISAVGSEISSPSIHGDDDRTVDFRRTIDPAAGSRRVNVELVLPDDARSAAVEKLDAVDDYRRGVLRTNARDASALRDILSGIRGQRRDGTASRWPSKLSGVAPSALLFSVATLGIPTSRPHTTVGPAATRSCCPRSSRSCTLTARWPKSGISFGS